jgi:CheY-like chemotaxis protein
MTRWLLVEDELDLYDYLHHLCEVFGSTPMLFVDGESAVAWVNALDAGELHEELPVFALIDIRMPGDIDGVHVAERIRRSPSLDGLPLVLMTAYRLTNAQEKAILRRSRADQLIYKPLPKISELRTLFGALIK